MPVSHLHRCVFVHIPKTGGTSIESALGMFHRWQDENTDALFGLIQSPQFVSRGWTSQFLQHLSYDELASIAPDAVLEQYLTFSWVRNPWERMISVYSNTDPNLLQHADRLGIQLRGLSFSDFLAAIEGLTHVHLRPQHEFIISEQGQQQVDFVGRFERFESDFAHLSHLLKPNESLPLPHKNASHHSHYRDVYNSDTRRTIERRYGADIDHFGYVF